MYDSQKLKNRKKCRCGTFYDLLLEKLLKVCKIIEKKIVTTGRYLSSNIRFGLICEKFRRFLRINKIEAIAVFLFLFLHIYGE